LPGQIVAKDEPVDALYRACQRYEELHARGSPDLDHAWSTVVQYYVQRVKDGDYLPPPPREMTDAGYFGMTSAALALSWVGRIMNEIERRRNLRGRGTSQSTAIL
jgi:hypothetical protein